MKNKIEWTSDFNAAMKQAKSEGKPIFLDFFNPDCIGCKQMSAVTYPNADVVDLIESKVVPVRLAYNVKPQAEDYRVKWTPTFLILDSNGKEHHRATGFMAPEELIPAILLGIGKAYLDNDEAGKSLSILHDVLSLYSKSDAAPEATYYEGVAKFKSSNDAKHLKDAYERLSERYPNSEWARRAAPYRLL